MRVQDRLFLKTTATQAEQGETGQNICLLDGFELDYGGMEKAEIVSVRSKYEAMH